MFSKGKLQRKGVAPDLSKESRCHRNGFGCRSRYNKGIEVQPQLIKEEALISLLDTKVFLFVYLTNVAAARTDGNPALTSRFGTRGLKVRAIFRGC